MSLTSAEVIKISHLARLSLDEEQTLKYARELSNILELAAQMNTVDTQGIAPTIHPLDIDQRQRPDLVTETCSREVLQHGAPQIEEGLYLVPQVIE